MIIFIQKGPKHSPKYYDYELIKILEEQIQEIEKVTNKTKQFGGRK